MIIISVNPDKEKVTVRFFSYEKQEWEFRDIYYQEFANEFNNFDDFINCIECTSVGEFFSDCH